MNRRPGRQGAVLLEVLCALAVLTIAGFAATTALRETLLAIRDADAGESELEAADRVLTALTLLTRQELTQRLGRRPVGEFVVVIQRPEAYLFRIGVSLASDDLQEILTTVVHRPAVTSR